MPTQGPIDRLESWKEIASYLKRDVRTVQRWEKTAGMPAHRLHIEKSGSVYAYRSELDAWWAVEKTFSKGSSPLVWIWETVPVRTAF